MRSLPPSIPHPAAKLTAREREILELVARDHSTKQISQRLLITVNTVDQHIRRAMNKMAVHSRAAAASLCIEHRLLSHMNWEPNSVSGKGAGKEET
jgi:two-component system NarL family response regulator